MRLLILIAAVLLLFYLLNRGSSRTWVQANKWKLIGGGIALLILGLVVTGKLPALAAIAAPFAAFGRRLWSMRGLLSLLPRIRQILGLGAAAGAAGAASAGTSQRREPEGPMTVKRAAEILGVEPTASTADIRAAHRRLIGKMHPDKAGTDYLAALVNEARDTLLAARPDDASKPD